MDRTENPTVLVTGASGRLGTLIRAAWAQEPPSRFRPLWQTRGRPPAANWLSWDMLAQDCPPLDPAPAIILNLAGVAGDGPELARNIALAEAALRAGRGFGCRAVLLASSAAVYGPTPPGAALDERSALRPVTAYGRAKAAMEKLARTARQPGVTCLRIGNVVGADGVLARTNEGIIVLDTASACPAGPERSWIGPVSLAQILAALIGVLLDGADLPRALNLVQDPPFPMSRLIDAAGLRWRLDPTRPAPVPRAALSNRRLAHLLPGPHLHTSPERLVAEWHSLRPAA